MTKSRTKALLLAGGLGTRLAPLTATVPKCLVPLGRRVLLDFWVDALASAGIGQALINTHHLAGQVRDKIAAINEEGRMALAESFEPALLGSAGTIAANAAFADDADAVLIIYADNLSAIDLAALLAFHHGHEMGFTIALYRAPDPRACGIAEIDRAGTVTGFVEKPEHPASELANAGVYVVDRASYREIAAAKAFDLAREVLPKFIGRMKGFVFKGYHRDIGTPEALRAAQDDVAAGRFRLPERPAPGMASDGAERARRDPA